MCFVKVILYGKVISFIMKGKGISLSEMPFYRLKCATEEKIDIQYLCRD